MPLAISKFVYIEKLLPFLVKLQFTLDMSVPWLHLHYKDLNATTNRSAPVLHIGTLTLVGSPLGFLP